ncbi:MAG: hypothetical protein IJJ93_03480 [Acidaminococcaceae bacterium]|nr:hypothetical protein [Acidaminococcaceae bacterium]
MSELLEKVLSRDNMNAAYRRVCANKGAGGVDGVTVEEMGDYIRENWSGIREQIRRREYNPQPVRRVEIPKPNGGARKLGIPTVMDRVIQQGIVQVIGPMCEPLFSEWSYGFRPNRNCEMAIRQLLVYLNEGYEWIVDILDCYKTLILAARRSGSFPEQSNKMNERSVAWRQTIKLSIFMTESRLKNRFAAGVTKKVRSLK